MQAGEELSKEKYLLAQAINLGGTHRSFSKDVKVYGWDDLSLMNQQRELSLKEKELQEKLSNVNDVGPLIEIFNLQKLYYDLLEKRNKKMSETVINMRLHSPDKRIFIISGIHHFEGSVKENLEKQPFIALEPKYQMTKEDMEHTLRRRKIIMQQIGRGE